MIRAVLFFAFTTAALVWAQRSEAVGPKELEGTWILETVAGKPPGLVNIKTWRITFSANQQWTYGGEMDGPFGGVSVNGSGSWKIVSDELDYTAGDNKGRSKLTIGKGILTLTPDPVVSMPGGKTSAVTTYKKGT